MHHNMKRLLLSISFLLMAVKGFNQLFTFTFGTTNTSTCVTDGNAVTVTNATVTPFSRGTGLTCESGNFNNSNWATGATAPTDLASLGTKYIEVTITPASGYQLSIATANFYAQKSSTGPTTAWVAHNLSGNYDDNKKDFVPATTSITSSANQVFWDFTDFTTSSPITFRIYAWGLNSAGGGNATTAGTFRIDKFSISGAITPVGGNSGNNFTPFTFDQANGFAGLGITPTQKLDVVGNIRASGKIVVGDIPDTKISTLTDYSLAVNGQALFTKARVLLNTAWPDYVFDKNYQLRSISELESFIYQHKHLPGVLPATATEKDGIDISTTQAALLEKIEELTLYLIQQDKKIAELQKQNLELLQLKKSIEQIQQTLKKIKH